MPKKLTQKKEKQKFKQDIEKKIKEVSDDRFQFEEFNKHVDMLKKKRVEKQQRGKDEDYIRKNKGQVGEWDSI